MLKLLILTFLLISVTVESHQESGEWVCESDSEIQVIADFRPGIITLDGRNNDWKNIDGSEFSLRPALDPDADKEYYAGQMTVKALHDGRDVYFMLEIDGDYVYDKGENKKCPSVALMFQIGDQATYHNMGGCKEGRDSCTSKACRGFEVDIMHFSIGNAIPGRLYGGNPIDNREGNGGDRFGHLVDVYAWNPHCRYLDGLGPSGNDSSAQNDWHGAWWHSSFTTQSGYVEEDSPYTPNGKKGTYYFEFSRPLRTMDRLQQDVQFTLGSPAKMSVAFWYPMDSRPWHGSGHYTIGCDWTPLDISPGSYSGLTASTVKGSSDGTSVSAIVMSLVSLGISGFIAYRLFSHSDRDVPLNPLMENNL